jgi:alginate O-acetyltransferase complex protein AlgI
MVFTEPAFLFLFLPLLLGAYYLAPAASRNALLTFASLVFYAIGEIRFLPWMIASIGVNYVVAIWIERTREKPWNRIVLTLGIASDLGLLLYFKYASWLIASFAGVAPHLGLSPIRVPAIALPLGISFFTFHKISYKLDVYRGDTKAQRNPLTLALYILFFPQLIAGPIIRYHDISDQLGTRDVRWAKLVDGVQRIIIGLAKKMIVANGVAMVADAIFEIPPGDLRLSTAWLGVLAYTIQIYFDFSGYSDMAIGLASLFGFTFLENFDHPYASRSVTEFWRRWHISLSRWFRDYLYVPLGGNRRGTARTYFNLVTIFFLCGLWHGANWTFLSWGLFHGGFLVIERLGGGRWLRRAPSALQRAYTMLVVMFGWVLFRASSVKGAAAFLTAMIGMNPNAPVRYSPELYLNRWTTMALLLGIVFSFPVGRQWMFPSSAGRSRSAIVETVYPIWLLGCLSVALILIAAGTYNPFLYFRF